MYSGGERQLELPAKGWREHFGGRNGLSQRE
jgi:hypothetical protein